MYNETNQELEQAQLDRLDGNITEAEYDRILTNAKEDAIAILEEISIQYASADDGIDAEHMRDVFDAPYPNKKYRSKRQALRTELNETI